MTEKTTDSDFARPTISKLLLICLLLFVVSASVRILVWQNNTGDIERVMSGVTQPYQSDARTLMSGAISKFVAGEDPPVDASILAHPPGYPILLAGLYTLFGERDDIFRLVQLLLSSFASILVFMFTRRVFETRSAIIAGIMTALSPQFAYYSAIILPDELSAVFVLAGLYFLITAFQDRRLGNAILCGISLGISCWLRSNALLLPIFFAIAVTAIFPRDHRIKVAALLLAAFIVTVAPVTLRNYVVFHSFIPLSLGTGTTFVEGLGDHDAYGRHGVPATDEGVMEMDARQVERPDYYGNLYNPDGIERERRRIKIGLSVVASDPLWYAASVFQRSMMTFRMERVPVITTRIDGQKIQSQLLNFLNMPLKFVQKLFITAVFLPLFLFGVMLMLRTKEQRIKLAILSIVPVYFAAIQSLLHTEYRYLLPASHVLVILAAIPISIVIGRLSKLSFQRSNG